VRIEYVPIIIGILIVLLAAGVAWDAWGSERMGPMRERRRRRRASVDSTGEGIAAIGMAFLGVALIGRDWRFETLTVLIGTILVVWGGIRNRAYIREALLFRGAARRGLPMADGKSGKLRIR
jgi:hypothetical protein